MQLPFPRIHGRYKPPGTPKLNRSHPLAAWLSFAHLFDTAGHPTCISRGLVPGYLKRTDLMYLGPTANGHGFKQFFTDAGSNGFDFAWGAASGNTYKMPQTSGTIVFMGVTSEASGAATIGHSICEMGAEGTIGYEVFQYSGDQNIYARWRGSGSGGCHALPTWSAGDTVTIAATYGPSGSVLYVNGIQIGSDATAVTTGDTSAGAFWIGYGEAANGWTASYKSGVIAFYVFDRALLPAEVASLDQGMFDLWIWPEDDIFAELVGVQAAAGAAPFLVNWS